MPDSTSPASHPSADPGSAARPRVAFVHHWLTGMRGGEKVLEALCALEPHADIFTLVCDRSRISAALSRHKIVTSFIERLPFGRRKFRSFLPLFPLAVEHFDLSAYDLVVSSDAAVVKGAIARPDARHICYCHSPPRYAWDLYHLYRRQAARNVVQRRLMAPVLHYLRLFDQLAAQRVDVFVANSRTVAARIARYYRRSALVIHPPVATDYFAAVPREPQDFYLFAGQLTAYKQPRLAIEACVKAGRRLVVVGDGPERRSLMRRGYPDVTFTGWVSDETLRDYYARSRALLFPGEEDFGIVPVEAQAAGAPVIALARGGALETVIDEETGLFFARPAVNELVAAIHLFERDPNRFEPELCRENARRFDRSVFLKRMHDLFAETLSTLPGSHPLRGADAASHSNVRVRT